MKEQPVVFRNAAGHHLFGILHAPAHISKRRIGLQILNPGLKNRVAPNRLNVKIARELCSRGFFVFRFDPSGIGDSEGEFVPDDTSTFSSWSKIQQGAFVGDTRSANTFFRQAASLDEVVLVGQCGAGVTALLAGADDPDIRELILIDTPSRITPENGNYHDLDTENATLGELARNDLRKMFSLETVRKLVTLDFAWRSRLQILGRSLAGLPDRCSGQQRVSPRFNTLMPAAFAILMERGALVHFLFAENDFSLREYRQDFKPCVLDRNSAWQKRCTFAVVKDANHIYTEIAWQQTLINHITSILATRPWQE